MDKPKWFCIGTVLLTCGIWAGYWPDERAKAGESGTTGEGAGITKRSDRREAFFPIDLAEEMRNSDIARQKDGVENLTDAQVVAVMANGTNKLLALLQDILKNGVPKAEVPQGELMMGIYTLLVMYRLTGEERLHFNSPEMQPFIKALLEIKTTHTYSLSMQANALALLPDKPEFKPTFKRVRDELLKGHRGVGNYTYNSTAAKGPFDNSNSQYGVLGVWACDDAGLEVDNSYWAINDRHWRQSQAVDGGWTYIRPVTYANPATRQGGDHGRTTTASMTTAGVASLYITQEHLDTALRLVPQPDPNIVKGLRWLIKDFETARFDLGAKLYTAYGFERVALASGLKYLGKYNWYKEGAVSIMHYQKQGTWEEHGTIPGTCYALLFLARGRSPVVFTKLAYEGPWDARPRDIANLNRWLVKKTERYINWQVVDMKFSEPDDWLDGPILVLTGHNDPKFGDEQLEKLRKFIRMGGMIFSTADGDDKKFTEVITKNYAPKIFSNQYEMRELPREHYVYNMDYKLEAKKDPQLLGLSNGVREVWIHSPKDMGATWQKNLRTQSENFDVPFNIFQYASGRASLRNKLDSLSVKPPPSPPTKTMKLGRLQYAGNYDPEPGGWDRFIKLAARDYFADLKIEGVKADAINPEDLPVIHMTGSTGFSFTAPEAKAVRTYLEKGGFLIVDSTGGNQLFSDAVVKAMTAVLPGIAPEEVNVAEHPVTTGGKKEKWAQIPALEVRKFNTSLTMKGRKSGVYEYKLKGRVVALVFEGDITSGLMGTNTWGIFGYTPEVSEKLAWNALVYATSNPLPPATQTAPAPTAPAKK